MLYNNEATCDADTRTRDEEACRASRRRGTCEHHASLVALEQFPGSASTRNQMDFLITHPQSVLHVASL
jgi:hypothetical protein